MSPVAEALPLGADCELRARVRWSALAFVALSLFFVLSRDALQSPELTIRAGMLHDLVAELPRGRQALVSNLWLLPMPTLLGLPFAPFVRDGVSWGLAHLHGLALVAALGVGALVSLLRRGNVRGSAGLAAGLMAASAAAAACYGVADGYTAGVMLLVALAVARHARAAVRALSGTFVGVAMLTHVVGVAAAMVCVVGVGLVRVARRRDRELVAINWVRFCQIIYAGGVYLLLNWAIMGDPLHAMRHTHGFRPLLRSATSAQLEGLFSSPALEGSAIVVSGAWGYLSEAFLQPTSGHHVFDFHPDKLPGWEKRDIVLVIPEPGSALYGLSDVRPGDPVVRGNCLLLERAPAWRFYLLAREGR